MYNFLKISAFALLVLPSCSAGVPGATTRVTENARLVQGPPIETIKTAFDPALTCMKGRIGREFAFSVGTIADNTGKEQYADNGTGKFVTQGAGDIVQSALFLAGMTVVNRRDPNIALAESNWGIRKLADQRPSDFYVTGSINSLDFIPGGGARIEVAGIGPRYRQSRILIGVDLALTAAHSGEIVANSSVQKQIYTEELGVAANRFMNDALLSLEFGGMEREALQLALRQILSFSTFDLLSQVASKSAVSACAARIAPEGAAMTGSDFAARVGDGSALGKARAAGVKARAELAAAAASAAPAAGGQPAAAAGGQPAAQGTAAPSAPIPLAAQKLGNDATSFAAKAIAAADSVLTAKTAAEANEAVQMGLRYMTLAIQSLRAAAAKGLVGPEGDAVATLVESAITSVEGAQKIAAEMTAKEGTVAPQPPAVPQAPPTTSDDKRLGGANN